VGAAGGVKLQAGVAVPSTAPEPEFTVFSTSGNSRQPEEQCGALRDIRQDSGVGSPCTVRYFALGCVGDPGAVKPFRRGSDPILAAVARGFGRETNVVPYEHLDWHMCL